MIRSVTASISALKAYDRKLTVTSDNLANLNTDGFKKRRVDFRSARPEGVQVSVRQIDTPGPPNLDAESVPGLPAEKSNVELVEEIPNLISGSRGYQANLKALKTGDEMIGTLLDMMG